MVILDRRGHLASVLVVLGGFEGFMGGHALTRKYLD